MPESNFKKYRRERDSGRSGSERLPLHHRRREARAPVAERRAQLLPTTSKKPTVAAMEEVRRGLVQYDDPAIHRVRKKPPLKNRIKR